MVFSEELRKYFETHQSRNSNEAKEKIKELTGIECSPTQVARWGQYQERQILWESNRNWTTFKKTERDTEAMEAIKYYQVIKK